MAVIVIYGGGFQPFHQGHMSSYVEAKKAFPQAKFYVVASDDTKNRPIPFAIKKFLAAQAGVQDPFVEVASPLNPKEVLEKHNPERDIYIMVRSERDPMSYTKKDGSPGYFQPFQSLDKCESFANHAYVFVTHKFTFTIGGQEIYSGSQVRAMSAKANDQGRMKLVAGLYPKSTQQPKIKQILDKYLGSAAMAEGSLAGSGWSGTGIRTWMNQVRREHGPEVKFFNKKSGGGVDNRVIAWNSDRPDREIVGSYNRNAQNGTVFAPRGTNAIAEGINSARLK